jgi:hypothetical protein
MPPAEQLFAENQGLQGKVASLQETVVSLETQVAWLKKQLFGGGKGESFDRSQLLLALGQLEAQIKAATPQRVTYERTPAKRLRRMRRSRRCWSTLFITGVTRSVSPSK